jgi:DNA-binding PadR family transcriptional regulator
MTPAVLHILLSLAAEDRHGLGIAADVKAFSQGRLSLGPGTLYGTIKRLLEAGLVEDLGSPSAGDAPATPLGSGDPRRRYYRITPKGRRALKLETEGLTSVLGVARRRLKTS